VSKKVLVADDEAHILHVVSMKLANAGYEVITALDGEEAYELCLAESPDLVITDYQMPYLTGLELCKRLRRDKSTMQAPVLMLTARGFEIEQEEIIAAGVAATMTKPFSPREVLATVKRLLETDGKEATKRKAT